MNRIRRYGAGARFYDFLSGERLVYGAGRKRGIALLGLRPGDTVLDLGCGTGLNFPLLTAAVGPRGRVIGLDRSEDMLAVARRRISAHGWTTTSLVRADATDFAVGDLPVAGFDALFSSYAMSVFRPWLSAWECGRAVLTPGARVCIVDMQRPTGWAAVFAPVARLACAVGGADIDAHPWTVVARDGHNLVRDSRRGQHIQIVAGEIY